jgi:predicted RNA-binding Zn-ribbon protein involved in translation (DUF1610 family)
MKKDRKKVEKWQEVEEQVQRTVEQARRRARVSDSFAEMETIAVEVGQVIGRALLRAMAEQQEPEGKPKCPSCGEKMYRRGQNQRQMKTSAGVVRIQRNRWVCPVCSTGLFPPGSGTEA